MKLYKDKYRITSTRLPEWDYASPGYYFITICTHGRMPWFGEVRDGQMILAQVGDIAQRCWGEIPDHFSSVDLDEYVIMPNHVHGIIVINQENTIGGVVETQHAASLQDASLRGRPNKNQPEKPTQTSTPGSLSAIVRSDKSAVTRQARQENYSEFAWQTRFYEHIIRSEKALDAIREYIRYNPLCWAEDEENPLNDRARS